MNLSILAAILATMGGFVSSAPSAGRNYGDAAEGSYQFSQGIIEERYLNHPDANSAEQKVKRSLENPRGISLRPVRTSSTTSKSTMTSTTTKTTTTSLPTPTTTSSSGTSSAVWTSINQANCPTSYPTAQPDFNTVPASCGFSWLDTVNMWRRAYNKPTFTWSAHLTQVAYGAAFNASGGAKPFKHSDLAYWGSFGEVETPGYVIPTAPLLGVTPFGAAIINWLCEVPSDKQLQASGYSGIDLCTKIQKNVDFIAEAPGETGHHDILLGNYAQIGCAFVFNTNNPTGPFAGIYVCDFK